MVATPHGEEELWNRMPLQPLQPITVRFTHLTSPAQKASPAALPEWEDDSQLAPRTSCVLAGRPLGLLHSGS